MPWLLVLLLAVSCFAPKRYAVDRPGLECQRAVRVARRTMETLGYSVTEMVEAKGERVPGVVAGTRTLPNGKVTNGRVRIVCTPSGAELQPIEDSLVPDYAFSRAFGYSFKSLVQRPDVETPVVQSGVQILVESLDVYEQRLDLGGDAVRAGNTLVRLTVRNGTDRAVALDADGVTLAGGGGSGTKPLAPDAVASTLAPGAGSDLVRRELLGRLEVAPRTTAVRYAVYPGGGFRDARINLEDVETKEVDGFVAPVQ
jgi:hypothetical protein